MKLYYREVPRGNFGDDLNPWLWARLLPGFLDEDDNILFVGIGSILNDRIPDRPYKVVFGSGVGYGKLPLISKQKWKIYCVRGPLSAERLGLPAAIGIGDAAVLVRSLQMPKFDKVHKISYMPHQTSAALGNWEGICDEIGIHFIHPGKGVEAVMADILSSELLITEAMHGAIVADGFRVPWIPVRAYYQIPRFKWLDWCASIGLEYKPINLPCLLDPAKLSLLLRQRLLRKRSSLKSLINPFLELLIFGGGILAKLTDKRRINLAVARLKEVIGREPSLSADYAIDSATACLEKKLEMFKNDLSSGHFERWHAEASKK
jgi:succinoglycan biosynthesis protein ExoV